MKNSKIIKKVHYLLNEPMSVMSHPEKILFAIEKMGLLDWMSEETYLKCVYFWDFKRKLNLDNPITLTEKLNWYKLNYRDPLMKKCVDKKEVRDYVKSVLGEGCDCLIEQYGVWESIEDINVDILPERFVLKPTNGSGDVYICRDKSSFRISDAKATLNKNLKHPFYKKTKEWAYYDLKYRIIAEKMIGSPEGKQVVDYKFLCFFGEPKILYIASDRDTSHLKFDFFDMEWNYIPVTNDHRHNRELKKPEKFDEMIEIARKLSHPFPNVRVDLYEEDGKVYFGELTFYHMAGFARFKPDKWDYEFGKLFDLSKIEQVK